MKLKSLFNHQFSTGQVILLTLGLLLISGVTSRVLGQDWPSFNGISSCSDSIESPLSSYPSYRTLTLCQITDQTNTGISGTDVVLYLTDAEGNISTPFRVGRISSKGFSPSIGVQVSLSEAIRLLGESLQRGWEQFLKPLRLRD